MCPVITPEDARDTVQIFTVTHTFISSSISVNLYLLPLFIPAKRLFYIISLSDDILHTSMTRHDFTKKYLKYNLPHIVNDTPELVLENVVIHSLRGFAYYLKMYILPKYQNVSTIYGCYICQFSKQSNYNLFVYVLPYDY